MLNFIKKLFGSSKKGDRDRKLSHPKDLVKGDIVRFSFLPQDDLSHKDFEVFQVNTYIYGDSFYPEIVLKDRSGEVLHMMVEDDDGDEFIAVSKKIPKSIVGNIISPEDMENIRKSGTGIKIVPKSKPEMFDGWLFECYYEVDEKVKGCFLKGDVRQQSSSERSRLIGESEKENFLCYILEDESDKGALEIEVYDTGEVEVCATVYHELNTVTEMWPVSLTNG